MIHCTNGFGKSYRKQAMTGTSKSQDAYVEQVVLEEAYDVTYIPSEQGVFWLAFGAVRSVCSADRNEIQYY